MVNIPKKGGYLELIIGPMFSGKTSKLLEIYKQCNFCNIPVLIINHSLDKRYHDTMMSSHDKIMAPCLQAAELSELYDVSNYQAYCALKKADVILINEGQFFEDLDLVVRELLNDDKKIYISGLDGDFTRNKFGKILDLIPICDNVIKLTSLCSLCKNGTPGIFSMRITSEKEQTLIGSENYIPVCRECYKNSCNY
jgi:thymidine kinase